MGAWSADSRTNVATMAADDFRHNEKSVVIAEDGTLTLRLQPADGGDAVVLRDGVPVTKDEIVDATVLRAAALNAFLAAQLARATADDVLLSVHLKATMMKVSDPVVFGHVVRTYFADVFDTYGEELTAAGLDGSNGLGAILSGLADLEHGAEDVHVAPPTARTAFVSLAALLVSLVAVIGLAKVESPAIEDAVDAVGAPQSAVGVAIALLVLLPETFAAYRNARRDRLQTSFNLAYGSAVASIGLTIPAVALASIWLDGSLVLGLTTTQITLLVLTAGVGALTILPGRATLQEGALHLVIFGAFLLLAVNP